MFKERKIAILRGLVDWFLTHNLFHTTKLTNNQIIYFAIIWFFHFSHFTKPLFQILIHSKTWRTVGRNLIRSIMKGFQPTIKNLMSERETLPRLRSRFFKILWCSKKWGTVGRNLLRARLMIRSIMKGFQPTVKDLISKKRMLLHHLQVIFYEINVIFLEWNQNGINYCYSIY